MTLHLQEPSHIDEPEKVEEYAEVIRRVAANGQTVILRRGGNDVAAIISLEYLELLQDAGARKLNDWQGCFGPGATSARENPPPPAWFDGDEPKPF